MALTPAQKTALKADIIAAADAPMQALELNPASSDLAFAVAALYNTDAAPTFTVWRTDTPTKDIKKAIVWTEYISAVSGAEHNAFSLIIANGIVNAGDANIRQGFADIFAGPNKDQTLAALLAIAKRPAKRGEKLFATGTGTTGSPGTLTFEGNLSFNDVLLAMAEG